MICLHMQVGYVSVGLQAMLGKHMEGKHMAVVAARAA